MIQKYPKPSSLRKFIKNSAKVLFVAEFAAFVGSFIVWYRMNRNQEFRGFMHRNFPLILEGYYKAGEYLDPIALKHMREVDAASWSQRNSESK